MQHQTRIDLADAVIFTIIASLVFGVLMSTMGIGVPRDESFYYHAAVQYVRWFEQMTVDFGSAFTQAAIDKHMSYNAEHPALMKMLFGISWKVFSQQLDWLSEIEALRLPAAVFAGGLAGFVYLFGKSLYGRGAGCLAVLFLFLQPRFFWHAHLACFDIPVVACWMAVVYGYWRSLEDHRWGLFAGLAWGIALSVKLNAFFLPAVLGLHWIAVAALQKRRGESFRFPWVFAWMAGLGPLLFLALWPRHWFETIDRIGWYLNFHLKHVHYFVYYFGENVQQPPLPISYPWVMTLVTVPATILLAFGIGAALYRKHQEALDTRATGVLLLINVIFPIALIAMPETPIFGGTKHWATAMPFVAVVAAGGVLGCGRAIGQLLADRFERSALLHLGVAATTIAVALPALTASVENHPMGPAYYNELIGSYRGAADLRMTRKFWGFASREVLPYVNEHAPKNGRIWTHNTTNFAWSMYQKDGLARGDLRSTSAEGSQMALFHHQKAFIYMLIPMWQSYRTRTPVHVVERDGVPYLSVYER